MTLLSRAQSYLSGWKGRLGLGGPDFEELVKAAQLDGLHVQLGEDLLHRAVVLDLGLEADELQRGLGDLKIPISVTLR